MQQGHKKTFFEKYWMTGNYHNVINRRGKGRSGNIVFSASLILFLNYLSSGYMIKSVENSGKLQ